MTFFLDRTQTVSELNKKEDVRKREKKEEERTFHLKPYIGTIQTYFMRSFNTHIHTKKKKRASFYI